MLEIFKLLIPFIYILIVVNLGWPFLLPLGFILILLISHYSKIGIKETSICFLLTIIYGTITNPYLILIYGNIARSFATLRLICEVYILLMLEGYVTCFICNYLFDKNFRS